MAEGKAKSEGGEEPKELSHQVEDALKSGVGPKVVRYALACLGAIPIVGGAIGGIGSTWSESDQDKLNRIFAAWLRLQEEEIREIGVTMAEVMMRLDLSDPEVEKRVESPEYLSLVKKCFRDWSAAESEDKRVLIRNLLANAAATKLCPDDVIRLFIEWIDRYSEAHFAVIKAVYQGRGATRGDIWRTIHGEQVREDSPEADLFKLLIHDLSLGMVIRQHRETDQVGNFIKQQIRARPTNRHMTSAFDEGKPYEVTGLGQWFVHYTMNEIVPRITAAPAAKPEAAPQSSA